MMQLRSVAAATKNKLMQKYYYHHYDFDDLLEPTCYEQKKKLLVNGFHPGGGDSFFVVQRSYKGMGLLTYVCVFVSFVAYAVEKGLVPVIDLCNSPNIYLSDEALKKGVNAWELYYDQPCGYTLKNIPGNAKVEYSSRIYLPRRTPFLKSMADKREWDLYRAIYRDFFPINDITKEYVEKEQNTLIGDYRSLGVLCRGTDYTQGKPKAHPIQPTAEEVIEKVRTVADDYELIYLATEEHRIEKAFREVFHDKVVVNKRQYYDIEGVDYKKTMIGDVKMDRSDDEYLRGLEYLSSIYLLSRCDSFIGGACAGTYGAIIMKEGKYDLQYVFDKGYYP